MDRFPFQRSDYSSTKQHKKRGKKALSKKGGLKKGLARKHDKRLVDF